MFNTKNVTNKQLQCAISYAAIKKNNCKTSFTLKQKISNVLYVPRTRILENQELFLETRALRLNIVPRCPIGLPVPII